jgi:hypothetical protein
VWRKRRPHGASRRAGPGTPARSAEPKTARPSRNDAPAVDPEALADVVAEFEALTRRLAEATDDRDAIRAEFRRRISALGAEQGADVVYAALAIVSGAGPAEPM